MVCLGLLILDCDLVSSRKHSTRTSDSRDCLPGWMDGWGSISIDKRKKERRSKLSILLLLLFQSSSWFTPEQSSKQSRVRDISSLAFLMATQNSDVIGRTFNYTLKMQIGPDTTARRPWWSLADFWRFFIRLCRSIVRLAPNRPFAFQTSRFGEWGSVATIPSILSPILSLIIHFHLVGIKSPPNQWASESWHNLASSLPPFEPLIIISAFSMCAWWFTFPLIHPSILYVALWRRWSSSSTN